MWTIHQAAEQIRARKLTPVDLLDQCLARVDQLESKIRAWVFVARDEARQQAERLTRELDRGQYRGPLHGIPSAVKDIFEVFDWPTPRKRNRRVSESPSSGPSWSGPAASSRASNKEWPCWRSVLRILRSV